MQTRINKMSHINKNIKCPNCHGEGMEEFYEVKNIPVHSVLLMPTREKALNYPRRDLKLGFCHSCGFVCNTIFDPTVHEYSTSCEESQGYSPTFNAFSRSLAKRWVKQYKLEGKSVLEIGCGKGEFLVQLVEYGMGKGIGIDPAFIPERLDPEFADKIEFIQDLYSEEYTHLSADVVCCRHTLEHIAPTRDFMQMIRNTIGEDSEALMLFELPEAFRVLNEPAFWDIYYEHCTYFTPGSLARLFRMTGFDYITELEKEYDDQYIVIVAKPTTQASNQELLEEENDLAATAKAVSEFQHKFNQTRDKWLGDIAEMRKQNKKVVIWGGGSKAVSFLTTLGLGDEIDYVVDINPHKHGKFVPGAGHAVKSPASLESFKPDYIILMNPVYEKEIRGMLNKMGLDPKILPV